MGKTRYKKITEVLEKLKLEHSEFVPLNVYNGAILTQVASSPQALKQVVMLINELNLVRIENDRVYIN